MKQIIFKIFLIISCLYISSCKDDFSPFGEYKERYALFSFLRSDSTFQVALIHRSYGGGSLDPSENREDTFISGAEVKIWQGDSVYFFRDSIINNGSSGNDSLLKFYYNNRIPVDYNQLYEIEALLPNGKRLKGATRTPKEFSFETSEVLVPPVSKDVIQINWNRNNEDIFFQPRLYLRYRVEDDPVIKIKEIPLQYVQQGENYIPVFPKPSINLSVLYKLEAVTRALNEISLNEQDKNRFSVYEKLVFEVAALDANLSRYVSSTSASFDDLTVRVNESDYTNIEGGFGVFGSYLKKDYPTLFFQVDYISSFGYNFINEED